jgi:centrin-1
MISLAYSFCVWIP